MPAPIVLWWDPTLNDGNGGPTSTWNAGTVDADSYSAVKELWVFNNKGGSEAVSDMTNVFVTTKDSNGLDGGPVADKSQAVVEVSMWDGASGTWKPWKEIYGSSVTEDVLNAAGWVADGDTIANRISGMVNPTDPNDTNYSDPNTLKKHAKMKLRLHVFENATAGPMAWKTRVSYQYT